MLPTMLLEVDVNSYMNSDLSLSERLSLGGQMIVLGLGTVFTVLALIWFCLFLFRLFFHDIPQKRRIAREAAQNENAVTPAPEDASAEAPVQASDENELIAVICAAISAARASEGEASQASFRVVSFKRK